jgi:hypothetical protein
VQIKLIFIEKGSVRRSKGKIKSIFKKSSSSEPAMAITYCKGIYMYLKWKFRFSQGHEKEPWYE